MTIDSVRTLIRRLVGREDAALIAENDPISKERIAEMQRDIHAKLGKKPKFTAAGPAGW